MAKYQFKVGDHVRIRTVESMIQEFGTQDNGDPRVKFGFNESMEHLCGRTATIIYMGEDGEVKLNYWSNSENTKMWCYSTDMIEPVMPELKRLEKLAESQVEADKPQITITLDKYKKLAVEAVKDKLEKDKGKSNPDALMEMFLMSAYTSIVKEIEIKLFNTQEDAKDGKN